MCEASLNDWLCKKELLKKYNQIRERTEKLMKIKFDNKPVNGDDEKYIKTTTKKKNIR